MKRCPHCDRVETDDTLTFCRTDGTPLIIDSLPPSGEAGTARVASEPTENETSILPHATAANVSRSTGPTTVLPALAEPNGTRKLTKPKRNWIAVTIVVVLVAATVSIGGYFYFMRKAPPTIQSIAVMPFINESGNTDLEYLSDGMTETLISSLSRLQNLNVKARSSVFRYKGKEIDPKKIGVELNVQAILNGRVVQRGDQLTLTLELIDAQTENVIWSEQYNRRQADLISLQSEIARDVSGKLKTKLSGADEQKVAKTYTANTEAYQLYLKGNFYASQYTKEGLSKGVEYYKQAIALDPNYALAYNGLAYYYIIADDWYLSPNDSMPKAREAAKRALAIDETLADAHTSMATVLHWYDWDWAAAEKEYQRAVELNPNDPRTRQYNAWFLVETGRVDEAIAEAKKAQQLDPLSPEVNAFVGQVLILARRNEQAVEQLRKTVELDSNYWFAHAFLGRAYEQKGDVNQALTEYMRARQLEENVPELLALVGRAYARSGKSAEAQKVIEELKQLSNHTYVPPYNFAMIYTGLGNKDEAFVWLNRAYDARSYYLAWFQIDSQMDSLHDDQRFHDLVRRVGFPK